LRNYRLMLPALVLLTTAMVAPNLQTPPVSLAELTNSIGMGDMPIWDDVASELYRGMNEGGYFEAKRIYVGNLPFSSANQPGDLESKRIYVGNLPFSSKRIYVGNLPFSAKRIFVGNAMHRAIPELDQVKLLRLMPTEEIPVSVMLMGLHAWHTGQLDERLRREDGDWWKPLNGSADLCSAIKVESACSSVCGWRGDQCRSH